MLFVRFVFFARKKRMRGRFHTTPSKECLCDGPPFFFFSLPFPTPLFFHHAVAASGALTNACENAASKQNRMKATPPTMKASTKAAV